MSAVICVICVICGKKAFPSATISIVHLLINFYVWPHVLPEQQNAHTVSYERR